MSIIIFALGGLFALYEGYEKLHDPHGITEWQWVPVAVLVGSILLEGNSFRVAVKESRELKGSRAGCVSRYFEEPGASGSFCWRMRVRCWV